MAKQSKRKTEAAPEKVPGRFPMRDPKAKRTLSPKVRNVYRRRDLRAEE